MRTVKIGEKIKALRTQKMMTQSELAGTQITRNMLSCIENGSSLPSVPTLLYLAGRLGVPAGLLLADENEEYAYRKISLIANIKEAFEAGDWEICRDLCLSLGERDDEIGYLICLCDFNAARDAFNAGNLRTACSLFDLAMSETENTSYPLGSIPGICGAYISYMREISPSFDTDTPIPDGISPDSLGDPFCRYYSVLRTLRSGDAAHSLIDRNRYLADNSNRDAGYLPHIKAKLFIKQKKFSDAYVILRAMLNDSEMLPAPLMYFIFSDLEVCCSELSDYKGAYEYSRDKVAMLERFFK